jgi:hypothetical protein
LYLNVCVRLRVNNTKEERRCSPVYDRAIAVEVDPVYAATHFVKDDPKWTISTMLGLVGAIGGGVTGIRQWRKRRRVTVLQP